MSEEIYISEESRQHEIDIFANDELALGERTQLLLNQQIQLACLNWRHRDAALQTKIAALEAEVGELRAKHEADLRFYKKSLGRVADLFGISQLMMIGASSKEHPEETYSDILIRLLETEKKDKERFQFLIDLVGSTRQATDQTVRIMQDDATHTYFIETFSGSKRNNAWFAQSLRSAIDTAINSTKGEK